MPVTVHRCRYTNDTFRTHGAARLHSRAGCTHMLRAHMLALPASTRYLRPRGGGGWERGSHIVPPAAARTPPGEASSHWRGSVNEALVLLTTPFPYEARRRAANFLGSFRKRVPSQHGKFPKEFPETHVRGKVGAARAGAARAVRVAYATSGQVKLINGAHGPASELTA